MLKLHVEHENPATTVIQCTGEVDVATCSKLIDAFDRLMPDAPGIRVDMRRVSFIDSTGIGCLLHAAIVAAAQDIPFEVVPGEATMHFIRRSGLGNRLPLRVGDGDA